jgi:hypothetical protein
VSSTRRQEEDGQVEDFSYHWRPSVACPRISQKYFNPHAMVDASVARSRSISHDRALR